jgi:hypothetical protein
VWREKTEGLRLPFPLAWGPNTWKHFGPELTQEFLSVLVAQLVGRLGGDGFWEGDYGWGVRVRRHLAHAGGALYGTELGSVTLKRIGFFCFPIKHSTHTTFFGVFAAIFDRIHFFFKKIPKK